MKNFVPSTAIKSQTARLESNVAALGLRTLRVVLGLPSGMGQRCSETHGNRREWSLREEHGLRRPSIVIKLGTSRAPSNCRQVKASKIATSTHHHHHSKFFYSSSSPHFNFPHLGTYFLYSAHLPVILPSPVPYLGTHLLNQPELLGSWLRCYSFPLI